MSEPEKQQDGELRPLIERLGEEFGPRPNPDEWKGEGQPTPTYGEARTIPQQTFQLGLPLGAARAIWVLLALNIAIYVIPTVLQAAGVRINGEPINNYVLNFGAKDNQSILDGQYYRLISSMFLHLGLLHIGVNGYSLYVIGPQTERIYGTPRFLALYFISGLAGGVASYALNASPGVGASGAIFGLVGGLAAFYYTSRKLLGDVSRSQLGSLVTVIMINLFIGLSSGGLIDNYAHMGGLAGGVLVGLLLSPRFALDERLYPPQIIRRGLAFGWAGAIGFLVLLVLLVMTINPPIQ